MKSIQFAGKLMYAIPMLVFGLFHFMNGQGMAGMVPSYFPFPLIMVYLTGAGLVAAAVSIVINKQAVLACLLLAAMLIIFVITIHLPGLQTNQMAMIALLKDVALAGGALVIATNSKS
jgi:putative oxidoreductase